MIDGLLGIVIGPLIVMMLIFLAFNNASFFEVKVATYSSGYSELSNEIVQITKGRKNEYTKLFVTQSAATETVIASP